MCWTKSNIRFFHFYFYIYFTFYLGFVSFSSEQPPSINLLLTCQLKVSVTGSIFSAAFTAYIMVEEDLYFEKRCNSFEGPPLMRQKSE